jgi:copper(I)-binding protein
MPFARALALASGAVLGAALVAGCGGGSAATTASSPAAGVTGSPSDASAAGLTLVDPYVRVATGMMTGVFGTLTNPTDADITVVSGSSPASGMVELHEVAMVDGASKMRPKAGGFVVPAHGQHVLKPGSDHIMLMHLTGPVTAGQTVTLTLKTSDGATVTATAIAKDIAAGNESYAASGGASMSPGMTMNGTVMPSMPSTSASS